MMEASIITSPDDCEAAVPTIACLCLASMRKGAPLDMSCWNDHHVAALFWEPHGDSPIESMMCSEIETSDSRKRPAPFSDDAESLNSDNTGTTAGGKHPPEQYWINTVCTDGTEANNKRRKIMDRSNSHAPSLFLDCRPEVLRHVRSFLTLQDALILRSTCRKLRNDGYDAYRYSRLLSCSAFAKDGYTGATCSWKYLQNQDHVLMRNQNDEKLRAILRNEATPSYHLRRFIWTLIKTTTFDNASAVAILMKDGRCEVDPFMLEQSLRRGYTNIAAELLKNDGIKSAAQLCATCNTNIGYFDCFRDLDCARLPEAAEGRIWCSWDDLPPKYRRPSKYCRTCVMAANRFCRICNEYLCLDCLECRNFGSCEACHSILCLDDFLSKQPVVICDECPRIRCRSCMVPEETWLEVVEAGFPISLCPDCKVNFVPGQLTLAEAAEREAQE